MDLLMDLVTGLPYSTNFKKGTSYDSILFIVDCLTKIVHDEPMKIGFDHGIVYIYGLEKHQLRSDLG